MISPAGNDSGSYPYYFGGSLKGMNRAVETANRAAEKISNGEINAENMVDLMQSEKMMKASAAALRTQDEVIGTLLNIRV
jgi:flagellar hook protein FlgE